MSASSNTSEKAKTHCDAVKSKRSILSTTSILHNSASSSSHLNVTSKAVNNGAKLNSQLNQQHLLPQQQQQQRHRLHHHQHQQQQANHQLKQKREAEAANKQDSAAHFQSESQKLSSDVQKVLRQEQELQKQLYSGSNVAPGWLRVNHNNKVIYISPSGIGLASLKQVKNYLLTRGTCKCGLPFPLRVELFFNFSTEVPTVPLKTPIDSIKFDPTCQHRKRVPTSRQQQQHNQQTTAPKQTDAKRLRFDNETSSGECLLPSYVTSASSKYMSKTSLTPRSAVMILNNNTSNNATLVTPSTHVQSQIVQTKQPQVAIQQQRAHNQQPQYLQHEMMGTNVVMRVLRDDGGADADGAKLPPWRKNSIIQQTQIVKNVNQQPQQQSTTQMVPQAVPIFQINGQNVIAIDQNNQQYHLQQPQQFQLIEQKGDGTETWLTTTDGKLGKTILRRRPTFKEDPTGYLNQQTALLQNSITTLHSPNENQSGAKSQDTTEKRQFIQQIVKAAPAQHVTTTIGGQTVTHMPNGVVQIQQNCDIKQATKPMMVQEPIQISPSKIIRQNPKGRPPKNPQTIAKRLVAMSQESPVSSTSNVRIVKSNTPDISSSSQNYDGHGSSEKQFIQQSDSSEMVKMTTKELVRTSMTQVKTITSPTTTVTSGMTTIPMRKPTMTMLKKPTTTTTTTTTMINPMKTSSTVAGQQIMMTSNGQQFIVMPQQQQQPQNIMLNNNGIVQIQNTNTTNQRIIQTATGQNGNFLIQSGAGNMLTTASNPGGNFILSNGQQLNPVFIQNGQIIQSPTGMLSPKGNILLSSGGGNKTIIAGNNQPMMGQQTVLLNGHQVMLPTQTTFVQDSSMNLQNAQQQNNSTIAVTPEKKKGRKRKIPLPEAQQQPIQTATATIQAPQQQNLIQGFQIAQPNVIKIPQQQHSPQFILQNGQTLIQQPLNLLNGQQLMLQQGGLPVMISPDGGNSIVQLQNPTFNNIIQTPQGMMIRAPIQQHHQQQHQQLQKTIITNNGQQFIVNQAGMNQMFNSPMGFIVQAQQNQQQQIINAAQQPIMMQTQAAHGQHIMAQPQIITQTPTAMSQGTIIGQQTQYIAQSDGKVSSQRKIIHQKVQQQKFFPQMQKQPRVTQMQTIVREIELNEEPEDEQQEDEEQEDNVEDMEQEEQEIPFDDDKQELIQELHHGQQQVLHHSMTGDGMMNIDDITIEMDEINDLNEYLNAIDEEDNRMTHIGLSSLQQQFANSPPDTTTHSHSPRSPVHLSSDKSNGSSDSTNMVQFVSSSEQDCISNVVSPEGVDSPSHQHSVYMSHSHGTFKLPEPKSSSMTSPRSSTSMSPMPQSLHMIMNDRSQSSPLMRPDSHGAEN